MITVLGQEPILRSIKHQHLREQVHHSLFFQGEGGVGKLETALWFAQGYFCEQKESLRHSDSLKNLKDSDIACGRCQNCRDVEFFNHPHILLLTVGDRIPALTFWQRILIANKGQPNLRENLLPILHQIGRDISQLLARHRRRLLQPVTKEKVTYSEGVKLEDEELEKLIHKTYLEYSNIMHPEKLGKELSEIPPSIMSNTFLSDMKRLQNSLDRSVLIKDNLDRMMEWCKHNDGIQKLVIIENIELINSSVVGLFLKILEDPPPQVSFILITEDMGNLNREVTLPLLSRCLSFSFSPLTGQIDEILRQKFHVETGFINYESNFQSFFQKYYTPKEVSDLDFLLQPIHQIVTKSRDQQLKEEEIVSGVCHTMEKLAIEGRKDGQKVKINYQQALSILKFMNEGYSLVKKSNYSKNHFLIELSLYIKKILKIQIQV